MATATKKEKKKLTLGRPALVPGTKQTFETFNIYGHDLIKGTIGKKVFSFKNSICWPCSFGQMAIKLLGVIS
jgi:hypothetical protein